MSSRAARISTTYSMRATSPSSGGHSTRPAIHTSARRLTKLADEYRPDTEPARMICASRPLFRKDEIQRILAVKLDHIGDLITALPALRRLRQHFPTARIHLLASGAAKAFLSGENCVDEHHRVRVLPRPLRPRPKRAHAGRFARARRAARTPYRFDLAMDLRKQIETRHVLQYVPSAAPGGL